MRPRDGPARRGHQSACGWACARKRVRKSWLWEPWELDNGAYRRGRATSLLEGSGLRLVLSTLCADWGGQAAVDWPATRRHHPPLGRSHSPPRSCIPATMRLRTPKAAVRLARLRWARIGDICRLARAVTTSLTPLNPRRDSQVFTMVARFTSGVGSPATSQ